MGFSTFVLRHMLALEGMFIEAGGEEAVQLRGVTVHGRVPSAG